ncbi:MAG TPA: NAD(P)/FAD-dependent oxidoreductase, partial [Woeseiaceae bacterium]|nr:NAD(P)/FAD-dependent oxidoreductase [Woeseiaceae bacterium]
ERAGVFPLVEKLLMPMRGRVIHSEDGATELQPYGQRRGEQIYSVSRAELNRILIQAAEDCGIAVRFEQEARDFDGAGRGIMITDHADGSDWTCPDTPVIAADGAGSAMRRALDDAIGIAATESLLPHGYKELCIPPQPGGKHLLDPNGLHIWPRGGFMLIALPNPGGDFTLTLFLPNEGRESFASLSSEAAVEAFFCRYFADVVPLIPGLVESFLTNPVGILGTVRCDGWHEGGRLLLIGDAAHAIVPFHGQGMNLAFEDCVVLDEAARTARTWEAAFAAFEERQLPNANAIADMALENYVEMRDTVRDPKYKLRKELSFELERRLPDRFIPRYSMVMFHEEIPYAVAQQRGAVQQALLDELVHDALALEEIDLSTAEELVRRQLPRLSLNKPL